MVDLVEEQRLLRGLLDASTTELQIQTRDLAVLAAQVKVILPSQPTSDGPSREAEGLLDEPGVS